MWTSKGRSGYGDTNLDGTYDDVILGVSPNGRQYRNEATLETRNLSGADYWSIRKQTTPEQEIPEALYARNETEAMSHTLANGQANLLKYADPVVVRKPVSKVSIKDKILPQFKRLQTLQSQMVELETEYKTTDMSISEYSVLRDVLVAKLQRAEVLYKRAISAKPIKTEEEYEEVSVETVYQTCDVDHTHTEVATGCGVSWMSDFIDELPRTNSFKKPLKIACTLTRKVLQLSQKARNYINELKAV